ncbi:hypothetical protein BKA69DRAFT_1126220 [Paraphysoderma sedebokerense]|nr:hypothetical protein BKA69DRAFT_1126220 [Paraphysoderma sedebokerense]
MAVVKDQLLTVIDHSDPDWAYVADEEDSFKKGYVPKKYIQIMTLEELEKWAESDPEPQDKPFVQDEVVSINIEETSDKIEEASTSDQELDDTISTISMSSKIRKRASTTLKCYREIDMLNFSVSIDTIKHSYLELSKKPLLVYRTMKQQNMLNSFNLNRFKYPEGFRHSFLGKPNAEGKYLTSQALQPRLTTDGLAYEDLLIDSKARKLLPSPAKHTIQFSLNRVEHLPHPGSNYTVISRHVRMTIFSKGEILSNIHTLPGFTTDPEERNWKFSSKNSIIHRKTDENCCIAKFRDATVNSNTSILFEFCMIVAKKSKDSSEGSEPKIDITETGEISLAWAVLPILTSEGLLIENKSYDLKLYSGSPWGSSALLQGLADEKGLWKSLVSDRKYEAKLHLRLWKISKSELRDIHLLPCSLITSACFVPSLSIYRSILAISVESSRQHLDQFTFRHDEHARTNPVLAVLPILVDDIDLMYWFVIMWRKKAKGLKRRDLKIQDRLHFHFTQTVLQIYPILHTIPFPLALSFPFPASVPHSPTKSFTKSPSKISPSKSKPKEQTLNYLQYYKRDGSVTTLTENPGGLLFKPFRVCEVGWRLGGADSYA